MNESGKKLKLLMVDDEVEFLESSSRALERRGFEVAIARDGVAALDMIQSEEYDVALLDVKMPGLDGVEVFRRFRKERPNMAVVILTGHGTIAQAFQTSREGIADYVAKPCDMDELADKLRRAAAKESAGEKTAGGEKPDETRIGPIQVLLVDDEIELFESLKNTLERRKMRVVTADSGDKALRILDEIPIDVVVLDVRMPGMDGLEVLKRIKKEMPAIEVILLSGHPSVDDAVNGIKMGASEYLMKPTDVQALITAINKVFNRRREALEIRQQELIEEIRQRYPD
nr:response regulator [candidate division Zixibacteria bacterium]